MMIRKIERTIKKYALLENGDRVIAALSGGADSCALLLSLAGLAQTYGLTIVATHFNHGLRGAHSDADEAFCHSLAKRFGLVFETEKIKSSVVPRGVSQEDYYRQERYRFLDQVAVNHAANKIALGHHLQDQAETVLLNLMRGSGLDGLKGILPMRENKYIRPLLEVSRREIIHFLQKANIEYREDGSNACNIYLRNRIRNELIPLIKDKYNPGIEQNLARMAEIIRRDDDLINGYVGEIMASPFVQKTQDQISFSVKYFKTLHAALGFRLVKSLLESLAPSGGGFSSVHIESLVCLAISSPTGKEVSLPCGLVAQKEYDLIVIKRCPVKIFRNYEYAMTIPGKVVLRERQMILSMKRIALEFTDWESPDQTCFDCDKIKEPLVVRNRRNGDWFAPLGTKGSQKIKKFMIDRKIPRDQRERIALIADQESVIWIENMHMSERVKVSRETKNVAILEIRPL